MHIQEVMSKKDEKAFLDFPRHLYKDDPSYVVPFDSEVQAAFDRRVNPYYGHGDAMRWLARNKQGKVIGRIAAFYDSNKNEADYVKCGGCGYFECTEDNEVAFALFDTAREWLKENGYEAMDGPVNFGENDTNWGCLVQGFVPPSLGMMYNKPYYREFFESYGFKLYYRQLSYTLDLTVPFPERFWKIAEWVEKRRNFSYRHFDMKKAEEFVADTVHIYNEAWPGLREDFTPMEASSLYDELRKIKDIMDPELIWYAYHEDEPIAFFMFLPDANQIFTHLNGRLHLINKLRFLWYRSRGTMNRARGTAAGVVPKYQNSGVESGIFYQMRKVMDRKKHYKEFELAWTGDFNPKMNTLYMNTGAEHTKTHFTYRYLFDPEKKYHRFMEEAVDETKLPENILKL